jgi:transposase
MNAETLFTRALGLNEPWKVTAIDFDQESNKMTIFLDWERGSKFPVSDDDDEGHGDLYPVHDSDQRHRRHLDFFQYSCELVARLPRVKLDDGRVLTAEVPWARKGSGFTLMMEALIMEFCAHMPVSSAAKIVREHDTRLWTLIGHYVGEAQAASDWSQEEIIAVDEFSTRKGHTYATNVIACAKASTPRLLFMTPGKDSGCVAQFAAQMPAHGGTPEQITQVAIDMSAAFIKGVGESFPDASVSFDRFHVMKLCGKACDQVRKTVAREFGALPKGAMWSLRGNAERLTAEATILREQLCKEYAQIGRAMALRGFLQDTWNYVGVENAREHLHAFCSWAQRSRLKPFVKLARTIRKHFEGILGYYPSYLTSAAIEAINGKIQTARRRAKGFRNFKYLQAISYWIAGDLQLELPQLHPTSF